MVTPDLYYVMQEPSYSFFCPIVPQRYNIYSGKFSSFSYYTPEENKAEQMTMWGSMSSLDCEFASINKNKSDDSGINSDWTLDINMLF